ncbi:hypothetical protein BDW59DRAFT_149474 [Aspergillus cavernicola]|uniref:Uncharacterized protein n=1 Tax=Aspergillus cavernicola TaxID=176166 RepID=A0ABR4I3H9_9EURO
MKAFTSPTTPSNFETSTPAADAGPRPHAPIASSPLVLFPQCRRFQSSDSLPPSPIGSLLFLTSSAHEHQGRPISNPCVTAPTESLTSRTSVAIVGFGSFWPLLLLFVVIFV